jgi:hypothetical protein
MKVAILLLVGSLLSRGATRIVSADEIVSRARWGMTQAQVLSAFPGEAQIVPATRINSFHGAQDRLATLGIMFSRLEQIPSIASFLFDDAARLDGIVFVAISDPQSWERFIGTEAALSGRYGQPIRSIKRNVYLRSVWTTRESVLELTYVYPSLFLTIDKRTSQTKQSMMADWTEVHGPHRLPGVPQPKPGVLTDPTAPPAKATISNN